jgi:hypothetical protein
VKTDAERLAELYWAASSARVRVQKAGRELASAGVNAIVAHHIDVALRKVVAPARPDLDEIRVVTDAIADLAIQIAAMDLPEDLVDDLRRARKRLVKSADAFLVDTQTID